MNKKGVIILLLAGFFVASCASNKDRPLRVDPTVISTSYDYTKPVDIAAQSRPVWILPVINKGWIPARVDPKTGDWVSGHYQATIVQDGYWATQEEAELSGRPYIVAGDSSPIIPTPVASGPNSGNSGAGELDLVNMRQRINNLEARQNELASQSSGDPDKMAEIAAELQGLIDHIPANHHTTTYPVNQNTEGYSNNVIIQGSAPGAVDPSAAQVNTQPGPVFFPPSHTPTIVLPPMPAGTNYEIPSNTHLPNKLSVRYLKNNQVEIDYMGKKDLLQLDQANARVQLDTSRVVNLDEPPSP